MDVEKVDLARSDYSMASRSSSSRNKLLGLKVKNAKNWPWFCCIKSYSALWQKDCWKYNIDSGRLEVQRSRSIYWLSTKVERRVHKSQRKLIFWLEDKQNLPPGQSLYLIVRRRSSHREITPLPPVSSTPLSRRLSLLRIVKTRYTALKGNRTKVSGARAY